MCRYRNRCGTAGEQPEVDESNPLPGFLDPITLDPVVTPAISPYGHVMGMATWKVSIVYTCAWYLYGSVAARQ